MAHIPTLQLFQRACQETFYTLFHQRQMPIKCPCLVAHEAMMQLPVKRKRKRRKKRKTIPDQSPDSMLNLAICPP